jgi:hypothetical protein
MQSYLQAMLLVEGDSTMKTYKVIIEQAMSIEADNEETAKRIAAECFDFGSADISANETESDTAQ